MTPLTLIEGRLTADGARSEYRPLGFALLISLAIHAGAVLAALRLIQPASSARSAPPSLAVTLLPAPNHSQQERPSASSAMAEQRVEAPAPAPSRPPAPPPRVVISPPKAPAPPTPPKRAAVSQRKAVPPPTPPSPKSPRVVSVQQPVRKTAPASAPPAGNENEHERDTAAAAPGVGGNRISSPALGAQPLPAADGPDGSSRSGTGGHSEARFEGGGLNNPKPVYPYTARRRGIEGRVVLSVRVTPEGTAASVTVASSSGHDLLDRAALNAVQRWRFIPAQRDGRTVPSLIQVPVVFRLQ